MHHVTIKNKSQRPSSKKNGFEKGKTRRRKLRQETGLPAHLTCLPIVQQRPRTPNVSPNACNRRGNSRHVFHPTPLVNIELVRELDGFIKWIEGFVE
jgi:hypothetical protein